MTRVLVVENDTICREEIAETLLESGYQVDQASNGRDALKVLDAATAPPAAILLDLATPIMNGWDFRRAQLEHPQHRAIPIVIMSGNADVRAVARELDAAAILRKPFDLKTLLTTLERLAPPPESAAG